MIRLHREGRASLLIVTLGGILINGLLWLIQGTPSLIGILLALASVLFFVQFFRNPVRHTPQQAGAVFSPADGTVVAIERVLEGEYFQHERLKLSIFMSVIDVHLNRVPFSGRVVYTRYHAGKYLVAMHPKSSELNERHSVVLETPAGTQVLVRQIAGLLARRIVPYLQQGMTVTAGQELGFIKFGSRCDVFLPLDSKVRVNMGQKVRGGLTILADLAEGTPK